MVPGAWSDQCSVQPWVQVGVWPSIEPSTLPVKVSVFSEPCISRILDLKTWSWGFSELIKLVDRLFACVAKMCLFNKCICRYESGTCFHCNHNKAVQWWRMLPSDFSGSYHVLPK